MVVTRWTIKKSLSSGRQIIPPHYVGDDNKLDTEKYNEQEYMTFVRHYLAEKQSEGHDFCAHCVAQFYTYDDDD